MGSIMKKTEDVLKDQQTTGNQIDGIDHASGPDLTENQKADDTTEEEVVQEQSSVDATDSHSQEDDEQDEISPLEKAIQESGEFKDAWQRERAEFSNYRKRMMHEKSQIRVNATGIVIYDLLEVLDNLDRVLVAKSENEEVINFIEGVKMIKTQFLDILKKHNVEVVSPMNEEFEPSKMEAITTEERKDLEKETVLEVYQDGYVHNLESGPHFLRPARVKVGIPLKGQSESNDSQEI